MYNENLHICALIKYYGGQINENDMGRIRNFRLEKLKERGHSENLGIYERIILRRILQK